VPALRQFLSGVFVDLVFLAPCLERRLAPGGAGVVHHFGRIHAVDAEVVEGGADLEVSFIEPEALPAWRQACGLPPYACLPLMACWYRLRRGLAKTRRRMGMNSLIGKVSYAPSNAGLS
jgi:hypothetical protein